MSQRTEASEFAPGFLWRISLLAAIALGFAVIGFPKEATIASIESALIPWVIAAGQTIKNGLAAFRGADGALPEVTDQARALAIVLITLIVCPSFFLLEWRRRMMTGRSFERLQLRMPGLFYALSGFITFLVALSIVPITIASEMNRQDLRVRQAVQSNRDLMVKELNLLALDIYQYRLLPREFSGGNASYRGYRLPVEQAKTQNASYSASVEDEAVTIHGQSALYPSAAIDVKVDSKGRLASWAYFGKFE
jgi:hypothetical protein